MAADINKKKIVYKWIRIAGLLSFIPFVLAAGPLGGYFLGSYLEKRFALPYYITLIFIAMGLIGSTFETVKIIRIVLRAEWEGDS